MRLRPTCVARSILLLVALTASPIAAQCPQWSGEFRRAGFDQAVTSVFSDGSTLYAGGWFSSVAGTPAYHLAAWDGVAWQPVGAGMSDSVDAITTHDDGTGAALYAGGEFTVAGGVPANHVARWNGSSWSALGSGVNDSVRALASFDDGSGPALYVGGVFATAGGVPALRIARWKNSVWTSIGDVTSHGTASGIVNALRVYDDGSGPALYMGGTFDNVGGVSALGVARWNGSTWSAVGAGCDGPVQSFTVYDAGSGPRLIAGGWFIWSGGVQVNRVASWDGVSWSSLGSGIDPGAQIAVVYALAAHDDGSGPALYASGDFRDFTGGGVPDSNIAIVRWNGSSWSKVGGSVPPLPWEYMNHAGRALAVHVEAGVPRLFMGGHFVPVGDAYVNYLGRWDGSRWSPVGPADAPDGPGHVLHAHDDGSGTKLYVGGEFEGIGSVWVHHIAAWDGADWHRLGEGLDGPVHALATFDDGGGPALFAGGDFSHSGYALMRLAKWNGSSWSAVAGFPNLLGTVYALLPFDDGTGPALYLGGVFQIPALGIYYVARWKNGVLEPLGSGMASSGIYPSNVKSLIAWDDGTGTKVFAGGRFDFAGGLPATNVARWDGANWSALAGGLDGDPWGPGVIDLDVWSDASGSALVAGGSFASSGPTATANLAKWDGVSWSSLGGADARVEELLVVDEGAGDGVVLIAGGAFSNVGGVPASGVAKWNGSGWAPLGTGLAGPGTPVAYALGAFDDGTSGGPSLFATGSFESAGGVLAQGLARWSGCGLIGRLYCFGDGSGTQCPCANSSPPGARAGCLNSLGLAGTLRGVGSASLSHDELVLNGAGMPTSSALYFQGTAQQNGGNGSVFGDGLRCAGGSVIRLATRINVSGASQYPEALDASISVRGQVTSTGTRTYQIWYRNAASFCAPEAFNLSNGLEVMWVP